MKFTHLELNGFPLSYNPNTLNFTVGFKKKKVGFSFNLFKKHDLSLQHLVSPFQTNESEVMVLIWISLVVSEEIMAFY